ncbi:hypothetical protein NM688_g2270 [Phlebia brevispora]|uniref:Uncharacterized protein n=1 Tax=Phlebia brevispora TaxID=194682 RepID=A0ACC1T8Y9_9APHY|nr:hypothetical protein NM688_g2270 [Phlebia brevispora]
MMSLSLSYISALDAGKRSRGAAIGLLFYDHLISLDSEASVVIGLPSRTSLIGISSAPDIPRLDEEKAASSVLPLCLQPHVCLPILYLGYDTHNSKRSGGFKGSCVIYLMCDAMITLVATILVQAFLQLRIYALYQRNRKILLLLLALSALEVSAMSILVAVTMSSLDRLPLVSTPTGCAYQGLLKISALFWIPGLVVEPMLCVLVAYRAWGDNGNIPLIKCMARDSFIYFIVIFAEMLVNTVIWAKYPQYINIFNPWSAALPSLLGSRLFLGMRKTTQKENADSYIIETYAIEVPEDAHESHPDDAF